MTIPVFRFAPSPNGLLHLGHAYSALFAFHAARAAGGRFLLRIEDIDTLRCRATFAEQLMEDLRWLGLGWEEPVRVQSEHMADYRAALGRLEAMGLVYPCFATRQEIAAALAGAPEPARDPDGQPLYPGLDRRLAAAEVRRRLAQGRPFAMRLDIAKAVETARELHGPGIGFREEGSGPAGESGILAAEPERWGDVVLARKDIGTSYHIAVVVDDALQGVTHVTRGHDLFQATHVHRLLQVLLGLPQPTYRHHRLISDETGRKLAKSAGDRSLRSLRESGVGAAEVRAALGFPAEGLTTSATARRKW